MDVGLQPPERQGMESSCQSPDSSLPNRPKEPELLFLMQLNMGQAALGRFFLDSSFPPAKGSQGTAGQYLALPSMLVHPSL